MKRMFLLGLMSLCCCFLNAQQGPPKDSLRLIQLSGVVVSSDSLNQMPFTTVFDRQSRRGTIADYYGFFSMVVFPGRYADVQLLRLQNLVFHRSGYLN